MHQVDSHVSDMVPIVKKFGESASPLLLQASDLQYSLGVPIIIITNGRCYMKRNLDLVKDCMFYPNTKFYGSFIIDFIFWWMHLLVTYSLTSKINQSFRWTKIYVMMV